MVRCTGFTLLALCSQAILMAPLTVATEGVAQVGAVSFEFNEPAPSRHAIQVLHYGNDDNQLDIGLPGVSIKGCGFGNDPVRMRSTHFDEAAFGRSVEGGSITIHLR